MRLSSSNPIKLFLQESVPTAKRTRSHSKDKVKEDTSNYAIVDHIDRHPDNIPPQVTPGQNRKNTKQNDTKHHEHFMDSIDILCKVHEDPNWIPTSKTKNRTKGVFVPLKYFSHDEFSPSLLAFIFQTFSINFTEKTSQKFFKFGITYYPSCAGCGVHNLLFDFYRRIFRDQTEKEFLFRSCTHPDTQAMCFVHRSLKPDPLSEKWNTEETILSAITFQINQKAKDSGVYILHRGTAENELKRLVPHDIDLKNFTPSVRGLGLGYLLMDILHNFSYTITSSDTIYLGCPNDSLKFYQELGFKKVEKGWKSLNNWVQQLAKLEGDNDEYYLCPCILTGRPLISKKTKISKLVDSFFEVQKRDLTDVENNEREKIDFYKTIYKPAFDVYLDEVLTQNSTATKLETIRFVIMEDPSKKNWDGFANYEYLSFFPTMNEILDKKSYYIKKGKRLYKEMFSFENWILNQFSIIPIRSVEKSVKFHLHCYCCNKKLTVDPLERDKFCQHAGSLMETHLFGDDARNRLCFCKDDSQDEFHSEDISVEECQSFFQRNRINTCLKHLMNDMEKKKVEIPEISKATYYSFQALIEMMTDKDHLEKLKTHMILSNEQEILNIEKVLKKKKQSVLHEWSGLLSNKERITEASRKLKNDNMVDTDFMGPAYIDLKHKGTQITREITDNTVLYYWTHIELVDPMTRHPNAPFPSCFPKGCLDRKQRLFVGYATLKTPGGDKEYQFLPSHNYTGTPDFSRVGELSQQFILDLEPNVKTPLLEQDRDIVLKKAVIFTRKKKIYSARLKITDGTLYGTKKDPLGVTYQIEVCERKNGPFYVVDINHIYEMFANEDARWVDSLFDIRTAGNELVCPGKKESDEEDDDKSDALNLYEIENNDQTLTDKDLELDLKDPEALDERKPAAKKRSVKKKSAKRKKVGINKDVSTLFNEKQNEVNMIDSRYDNSSDEAHRPDSDDLVYDSSDDDDDDQFSKIVHRRKEMDEQMKWLKKKSKSYHFFICEIY